MSKHEIEIEGLPEGWEPVRFGVIRAGDSYLGEDGKIWTRDRTSVQEFGLIVRRKVRKYDWGKTLDDVLVTQRDSVGLFPLKIAALPHRLSEAWQPNIHGKCPVDGEASWVRVRQCDGQDYEDLAKNFNWDVDIDYRWQFIRLADGWEW